MCMCVRQEGNLQESPLFSHHVSPGEKLRWLGLAVGQFICRAPHGPCVHARIGRGTCSMWALSLQSVFLALLLPIMC